MFRWSSKLVSMQNKPGLLLNYNTRWNYMSWTPGGDAIVAWYMYAGKNKDILRLAFEQGMDGNASFFQGGCGYTWVPKCSYNVIMDYWLMVDGYSATFQLYVDHGLEMNRPFSPQRMSLLTLIGWMSNNGPIIAHILEHCPDPDEALAYTVAWLGTTENGARMLGNTAVVDAIDDFKRKRAEALGRDITPGAKSRMW